MFIVLWGRSEVRIHSDNKCQNLDVSDRYSYRNNKFLVKIGYQKQTVQGLDVPFISDKKMVFLGLCNIASMLS